jgi:D-alanyl-D-alanine carboxypeptidase
MVDLTRRVALAASAGLALMPVEAVGAGNDRALVRRLRDHCDHLARDDDFNGVVLLVKDGRTLFQRAYGLRNRSDNLRNNAETKFNLASVGKMFTSLSIMRFAQAGRLRLAGRLIEAWPDYPDRAVAERITLEQILTHSSGLGNYMMFKPKVGFTAASTQSDYAALFTNEGLSGEPGSVAYSNDGYVLLGALIERLSGKDYREHCRETIFAPLGMDNTGYYTSEDIIPNLATPYARDLVRPGVMRAAIATDALPGGAFGGGYSTVGDLARFGAAMRANQLLPPELTRDWTRGRVPFRSGQYGYGIQVETINGHRVYGHTGGHYGVAAEMMIFEGADYLFVQLSNCEVETYWDLANFIRAEIAGESDASRNYAFMREVVSTTASRGVDAGLALAAANPERRASEGFIDSYGFRAWHSGDTAGSENLLRFNLRRFPDSLSALWSIAEFYRYAGRNAEAIAAYRAFLERQPDDADALSYIARLSSG